MKLVVFDIDGTLTDTKAVDDRCFIEAMAETFGIQVSGHSWDGVEHVTDWGITLGLVEQAWGRLPSAEEIQALQDCFVGKLHAVYADTPERFREVPGARAFVDYLDAREDCAVALATGSWEASALIKLGAVGISPEGRGFGHSGMHVSRADIMAAAISQAAALHGLSAPDTVYFGDGAWDYLTCQAMAVPFIGVDVDGDGKLAAMGAKKVIRNFLEPEAVMALLDG